MPQNMEYLMILKPPIRAPNISLVKKLLEDKYTSAVCICGNLLISTHRHDFASCHKCGTFVDGGNDYARGGFPKSGIVYDVLGIKDNGKVRIKKVSLC